MNILALDTANSYCSAAIITNGEVVDTEIVNEPNKQAELLLCIIEDLLTRNHVWYEYFNAFVVTHGPGSFTGIKIGMAAAQGMSVTTGKPLYGVSTLEVAAFMMAKYNEQKSDIQIVLNAGRNRVYNQRFSLDLVPLTSPEVIELKNVQQGPFLTGSNLDKKFDCTIVPDAQNAGLLASRKIQQSQSAHMQAVPLYIR